MSKLRINDRVKIKGNGKIGTVKSREVHDLGNNRVKVEYIVKTGTGFENWNSYTKNELEKTNNYCDTKPVLSIVFDAPNGYKVTLAANVVNHKMYDIAVDDDDDVCPYVRKGKDLTIGYAIYNPSDEYDYTRGVKIALHRAKKAPFCHLVSDFNGEFNKETVDALLKVKGEYIVKNLDHFIKG